MPAEERLPNLAAQLFPGFVGLWIALGLIKFGNPVILDSRISAPKSLLEAIYQPWPVTWGYGVFAVVVLIGLLAHAGRLVWSRFLFLPLAWVVWQCFSALQTVESSLSRVTVPHLLVCGLVFYVGFLGFPRRTEYRALWLGIIGGWLVVVAMGWRQHFGGLAETREFFQSQPNWQQQPPELIAKVASDRIYSTLVYPNALAGVMLLFTPPLVIGMWEQLVQAGVGPAQRAMITAFPIAGAVGCLVWSGSKGGWLIAILVCLLAWFLYPQSAAAKMAATERPAVRRIWRARAHGLWWVILAVGVAIGGFWWRYSDYFARGATSVSARIDYWTVAWSNAWARPVLGSGPGTFMTVYRAGKPPQAEMTRLVHNDYLQQATDSGWVGGALFVLVVAGAIWAGRPQNDGQNRPLSWFGVWLGVVGLAVQSLTEFGLYIPALAWPWFLAMGALASKNRRQANGFLSQHPAKL